MVAPVFRVQPFQAEARRQDSDSLRAVGSASGRSIEGGRAVENRLGGTGAVLMMTPPAGTKAILPPKGLLIALVAQIPLVLASLPLRPSLAEIAAGILLLAAGIAINVWAERQFRHAGVGVCPFSPAPIVVESGPYRITRNPMYVGLVALCLSTVLLSGVPLNSWTAAAYAFWLHRRFVLPEERFLLGERGEAYAAYARRVPRWIRRSPSPRAAPPPPRARR